VTWICTECDEEVRRIDTALFRSIGHEPLMECGGHRSPGTDRETTINRTTSRGTVTDTLKLTRCDRCATHTVHRLVVEAEQSVA
jgi:hypothetical protein